MSEKNERRGGEESEEDFTETRLKLRGRWELASVLNFLRVFQPIVMQGAKISAEEIETALMKSDHVLAKIHVALLKGIPPVSKNLEESDVWMKVLSKKLQPWWPWVAEGEAPLPFKDGIEISSYKALDPLARLLILKALCEVRLQQDDMLVYVDEEVKCGGHLSKFRKDSIYEDSKGTTYWYDGDSVVGHRLYKNVTKIDYKPRAKGRGRLTQAIVDFQWETLATNFTEFQQITDKLLSSKVSSECAIGTIVKDEILPDVEETEKKKERMLKRKQRQARLFEGLMNCHLANTRRSCRDRRPVSYTFDEYDQSINEAIQSNRRSTGRISPARSSEHSTSPSEEPAIPNLPEARRRLRERLTTNTGYNGLQAQSMHSDDSFVGEDE